MVGHVRMLFMVATTGLCAALAGPLALIDRGGSRSSGVIKLWSRLVLWQARVELRIEGFAEVSSRTGLLYVSSHESVLDVPALYRALPSSARFLAKSELFDYPLFGWCLGLLRFVPIARAQRGAAREALDSASELLLKERSLVVFPEGTRSRDGELGSFKKGAFALAIEHGLSIVPVACVGGGAIIPAGRLHVTPGPMHIRFGQPIEPSHPAYEHRTRLMRHVHERVQELRDESGRADSVA